jgi:hypothetical protein
VLLLPAQRVNNDGLYRALEQHLVAGLGEQFAVDYNLLLNDVTSAYFEGLTEANPLATAPISPRSKRSRPRT